MGSQMYGVSGKRIVPNTVAQINAQTAYLPALYRQKKEDELAKRGLDLQERAITTNQELSEEALAEQKRQAKLSNYLGLGNLGVKAGLGAYQASDTVKDMVDKFLGGGKSGLTDMVSKTSEMLPLQSSFSGGGDLASYLSSGAGNFIADAATSTLPKMADYLFGGGGPAQDALSSVISSGSPYADYITSTMDYLGSLF